MKSLGLQFFTDINLSLVGLIIFFTIFVVMIVLHSMQYKLIEAQELSQLPLEGENDESFR